jgi:Glycosyltransferase family 87
MRSWSPEWRDCFLYALSALFAVTTFAFAGIPLYRQWGELAVGPYAAVSVFMAVVAWRAGLSRRLSTPAGETSPEADLLGETPDLHARRWRTARIAACGLALVGATLVPLALEVTWASEGNTALHVQPEVEVVERAGARVDAGKSPYQVVDQNGHVLLHSKDLPVYELYYPYLPGMVLFGFSSGSKVDAGLSDARIQFLVFTVLIGVIALSRIRPASDLRFRALQVLTVLPTAALPLATGGDDMPVASLMLLGLVALQRRRPLLAGLALGAASSLKFTAWPLVLLAAWCAFDRRSRRSLGWYVGGVLLVVCPVVLPVALSGPSAFVDNVIKFPLGLTAVASPAASPFPGHYFVDVFPSAHRAYVVVVVVVGLAVLGRHLLRHPPADAADAARLTGWVMLVAIVLAPATRVGYLLYPADLFVWAWMLRRAADPPLLVDEPGASLGRSTRGLSPGPPARIGQS